MHSVYSKIMLDWLNFFWITEDLLFLSQISSLDVITITHSHLYISQYFVSSFKIVFYIE